MQRISMSIVFLTLLYTFYAYAEEINGSPFSTEGAPLPPTLRNPGEKVILIDPNEHVWGAYNVHGKLIRWGIASAGRKECQDTVGSCRTRVGTFRIYSLGNSDCLSRKYDNAPMPYCMFFSGSQALHGSSNVEFENVSHGCVRIHVNDAEWLRYHFVEAPSIANRYQGTKIIIQNY